MYSFPQQDKIFKDLLAGNSSNKQCADCNCVGPTWASLKFGVFLCSNCSGAHRALGPTITRVKSTKLDQWQKQWMDCMMVGNKQLNMYWQSDLGMAKKPKMGAVQPELIKYATQKYVKRKYVRNGSQQDPLTRYRNGTYVPNQVQCQTKSEQSKKVLRNAGLGHPKIQKPTDACSNVAVQNQPQNLNLIQFEFPEQPKLQVQSQTSDINRENLGNNLLAQNLCNPNTSKQNSASHAPVSNHDDDEFSQFTEHGTSFTGTTQKIVTYEQLFTKKSNENGNFRLNYPAALPQTHSASSIPHSQHDTSLVNMNGHGHHVGAHQVYGNASNFNGLYNQPQNGNNNPYQSVGYIPAPQQAYSIQQFLPQSQYAQNQNMNSLDQKNSLRSNNNSLNPEPNNNNLSFGSLMSNQNQQNLNPQSQSLGGYHNQGYGSHQQNQQNKKKEEFHWNDFSGIMKPKYQTPQNQNKKQQNTKQNENKSWVDDWK